MDAPAERRRFYLQQGLRKLPTGSGSSLSWLMSLSRDRLAVNPREIFGEIPVLVAGGIAVRAYAPERVTKDIDILVAAQNCARARERLRERGWKQLEGLAFSERVTRLVRRGLGTGQNGARRYDERSDVA